MISSTLSGYASSAASYLPSMATLKSAGTTLITAATSTTGLVTIAAIATIVLATIAYKMTTQQAKRPQFQIEFSHSNEPSPTVVNFRPQDSSNFPDISGPVRTQGSFYSPFRLRIPPSIFGRMDMPSDTGLSFFCRPQEPVR